MNASKRFDIFSRETTTSSQRLFCVILASLEHQAVHKGIDFIQVFGLLQGGLQLSFRLYGGSHGDFTLLPLWRLLHRF